MLRGLDRTLAVLLVLGAIGHALGSSQAYAAQPVTLLWALCASLLALLLAAINWLRTARAGDRALAWIAAAGSAAYVAVSIAFGVLIGNPLDFRPVTFVLVTLCLTAFSVRDAVAAR